MGWLMSLLRKLRPHAPACAACGRVPPAGEYHWDLFGRAYTLCQGCRERLRTA